MITTVGLQNDVSAAVKSLIELDFDAIEAYDTAIHRLDDAFYKSKFIEFKADHERHVRELSAVLSSWDEVVPKGPTAGQWLTKGKVILGDLIGDKAILLAMLTNEMDTNTAYERVIRYEGMWPNALEILRRGLLDERRHKSWFEEMVKN